MCDLGTDCDDCGAWTPSAPPAWIGRRARKGPVALLREKGVEMRVRLSSTNPGFFLAYTDPKKDFDVSGWMDGAGVVEAGITKIFYKIFKQGCIQPNGKRALFADVGANFGWFSVFAAAMGCRVIAFEPVPHFHAFLEYSVHINGFAHLVDMRSNVVSHEAGKDMEMVVPSRGIWGTAGIGGLNIDRAVESSHESIMIPSVRLEEVVKQDVLLLKVDVEGWEWSVLQGAAKLLKGFKVENVIMEYSPGVPERHFKHDDIRATVQMLINLCNGGYRIHHIGDMHKHGANTWDQPLDPMEEITVTNLMYDLEDAARFKASTLGCPLPDELKKYPDWSLCNTLPEDLNPRSLRSMIGHNTNIWASKNPSLQNLKGMVGIIKPGAPSAQFFVGKDDEFGMGSRPCAQLDPKVQVRHRCHCTKPEVCGEEQKQVELISNQGKISSNYVLPTTSA